MAGNADAIAKIGWDNTDARRGARDFLRLSEQTNKAFSKVWDGAKFGAGFLGIGSLAQAFGTAMQGIKQGLDFNTQMSDAEAGIANVLRRFDGLNRVAAKNEAAKAMQMIADLEPVTAGGLQDLVGGFMGTVAAAKAVGLTTEQNIQLVSKFANALANAGLPVDQLRQEMASILSGNITSDSQLAKILGITNEEVNAIKARGGNLFTFLLDKLGDFGEAGDSASVVFSSLLSASLKFLGAGTAGIFDELIASARELAKWLEANTEDALRTGRALGDLFFILRSELREVSRLFAVNHELSLWDAIMPSDDQMKFARWQEQRRVLVEDISSLMRSINDPDTKSGDRMIAIERLNKLLVAQVELEKEAAKVRRELGQGYMNSVDTARKNIGEREKAKEKSKETGSTTPAQLKEQEQALREQLSLAEQRQKLDEIRRKGLYDSLSPLEQMAFLEGEIADLREGLDTVPYNAETRVRREQELAELLNERAGLQRQINQEEEHSLQQAAERAKAEAEIAQRQAESLEEYQMQNAILREQIAGHDEKAKQLQRELEIQRQAKQIQEQMGVSEAEALRMARERADLEDQANKKRNNSRYDEDGRRKSDGRKRIVTRTREDFQLPGSVPSSTPLLDDFYRKNRPGAPGLNETFRFPSLDEMNKRGPLRDEFKFPGLDAFEQMQQDKDPLKDKAQENNAEKTQGDPNQVAAQQVIQKMDAILTALG